ncbi:hypothetical protein FA15DRAFT_3515 [Coprinopsis marcescibilis]|uniref:Uncharacterized protein n=1 Tax=Coprinopsis marcescibilis TaxID=230819 RepID=A0A5C3LC88_COPMA|nr:hypothetical protein FA15DRAFT_3515 [Coprinopsis marcescibilis]
MQSARESGKARRAGRVSFPLLRPLRPVTTAESFSFSSFSFSLPFFHPSFFFNLFHHSLQAGLGAALPRFLSLSFLPIAQLFSNQPSILCFQLFLSNTRQN